MDLGLKGKVALVTGAASGIGRVVAMTLAEEGANVVAADLKDDQARVTEQDMKTAGIETMALGFDVRSFEQAEAAVQAVIDRFGKLDVLVNCAGAWRIQYFVDSTPEDWKFEIDTNLMGVIHCTRAALGPMITQAGGKIVNVSSDAGRVGEFRQSVYSGAKAGIIGFSKAVAREVGRYHIHVNCVCPGITDTPGVADFLTPEIKAAVAKGYPLRKIGTPEDIAPMIVFLASNGASHMTGQAISISGGYTMV